MAEPRRVEFQTISSAKEEKKEKKPPPVPRFTLALGESTATTCPEFSFTELLKKGKATTSDRDDADPFGEEDGCHEELAALAKKYEEKYGPKPGKKRKLKCLEDEYFDLGDGYDENDPFIDNTEAYDEVVPSCLTTKHGGFYINRGTLDFRTLSDQDDSAAEFITPLMKKRGRPRKILDSDEDEPEEGTEPKKKTIKKKKLKEGVEGEQKKKKRKMALGPDGEKIMKRKKIINPDKKKKTSPTVKELLKQQTASTANHGTVNGSSEVDNSPAPSPPQEMASTAQDHVEPVFDMLQDGDDRKSEWTEFGQNQLPADLPADLGTAIIDIKQAAKDSKEGKCKFFSPHVNKLLLDIELASRQLAFGKRKSIYAHLADHLPCGKETLIKRAKKLRENQQDDQVKVPIQRLKEEIDKLMPALQEQHELDVAKARQEFNKKLEGAEVQKEEGVNTESDDEDKSATPGVSEGQSRKGNRDPRKKFKWTSEIRSLLCQIVGIKMRMFDTYKFRNQTAEEYLKTFLENEIKVLWPQGWIQTRMLYKETRSVHGNWTNPLKPKRPLLVPRSTGSPTPNQPVNTSSNVCDNQANDVSQPPSSQQQLNTSTTEVIEVSDIDEPAPPAPSKKEKCKAATNATTILDAADGTLKSGESLKFSPNSMEAIAVATAAAVAAAVASPKVEPPSMPTSLGERRPHLVSEILKKPGLDVASAATAPPTTTPTTPLTPVGGKDSATISPFLAEFSRYLTHTGATPQPQLSSMGRPSLQQQMAQQASQLQSKTVSSSTTTTSQGGRVPLEDKRGRRSPLEDKKLSSSQNRLPPIQWQMEAMMGMADNKATRKQHATPATAHQAMPQLNSNNLDTQQARLQKMTALLMGQDSSSVDSLPQQQQQQQLRKTKGDIVRDQILSQIQAEIDASNAKSGVGASGGVGAGRQTGEVVGKRTTQGVVASRPAGSLPSPPAAHHTLSRQSPPVPPPVAHQASSSSRQSPVLAHHHSPNNGNTPRQQTGTPGGCRQQPPASLAVSSRQSPTPVRNHQAALAGVGSGPSPTGKQQAVVSPNQGGGNGTGGLPQVSSRSLLSTFQSRKVPPSTPVQQLSPPASLSASSPASIRAVAPVRPGPDPTSSMRKVPTHATSSSPLSPAVRPVTSTPLRKPNPSPSASSVSSAHPTQPFQRNPTNTPQQQPPFQAGAVSQGQIIKVNSACQGQNAKAGVSLGLGQIVKTGTVSPGQNVKVNTDLAQNLRGFGLIGQVSTAGQRVSPPNQNQGLLRKSSPTNPVSQGQRNTSAAAVASVSAVQPSSMGGGTDTAQKLSQKLPGATMGSGSGGLSRGQALGQTLSQQIEREVRKSTSAAAVQNSRGSPGQWSGGGQTAPITAATKAAIASQPATLASNQGSNPANAIHSIPPAPSNKMMVKGPRLQEPGNVAGKTQIRPSALSGIPGTQGTGLDPQAVVTSGLFNHRPVFRPLHSQTSSAGSLIKESPRPTQGFGN